MPARTVSVLIPVVGEATRIEGCLRSVLDQDWPHKQLEIVVIDGAPGDGTAAAAQSVLSDHPNVMSRVVSNPGGGRGANLNAGLAVAVGEAICRVDARSTLPPSYLRTCVELLDDPSIVVVGGSQVAKPSGSGERLEGIARGLGNRLAMGMARYRRGGEDGPTDTVYLGAFRSTDVRSAGGWSEDLDVNEDFDLNQRLSTRGTVWYAQRLRVGYEPRSTITSIAAQYWGFGRGKVRYLRRATTRPLLRQVAGLAVVPLACALSLGLLLHRRPARLASFCVLLAVIGEELGTPQLSFYAEATETRRGVVPLRVRLWSLATCGTITCSWSAGAWFEIFAGRPRR